jgi:hypothetical protein
VMPSGCKIRRIENWLLEEWFAHPCTPNLSQPQLCDSKGPAHRTLCFLGHRPNDLSLAPAAAIAGECRQYAIVSQVLWRARMVFTNCN